MVLLLASVAVFSQAPNKYQKQYDEAVKLFNKKDYEGALTIFNNVIKTDSTELSAYRNASVLMYILGDERKVKGFFDAMIRANNYSADAYLAAIMQLDEMKDFDTSSEYVNIMEKNINTYSDSIKIIVYNVKSQYYDQQLMHDSALYYNKKAYDIDPNNEGSIMNLALTYGMLKRLNEAADMYKKLIDKKPDELLRYNNLGYLYNVNSMHNQAFEVLDKGIAVYTKNPKKYKDDDPRVISFLYSNRGEAKANLDDTKGAFKDFEKAIELYGQDPYVFCTRAKVYLKQNKRNEACIDLYKASSLSYTEMYGPEVDQLLKKNCK